MRYVTSVPPAPRRLTSAVALAIATLALLAGGLPAQQGRGPGRGMSWSEPPASQAAVGYAADAFKAVRGGVDGDPAALGNLDLLLHLHLDALPGFRRTQLRVQVQSSHGESVSSRVGDLQGVSNLEAPDGWRLYEVWIQRQILRPGLSVLAGIYDLNSEFDVVPGAGDFLNGSFGFGPEYGLSGRAGPSTYPSTGLAARIRAQVTPSFYALLGASDAVPEGSGSRRLDLGLDDGALVSFEAGYARSIPDWTSPFRSDPAGGAWRREQPGRGRRAGSLEPPRFGQRRRQAGRGRFLEEVSAKVAVGGWAYTRRLPSMDPEASPCRSWGAYLLGEKLLRARPDGTGTLTAFARVGTAAEDANQLDLFMGGGLAYGGPLPCRPDDAVGLGVAHARNGSPYLRAQREAGTPREKSETVVELTYRAQLGDFLVIQPDLQWVQNPGMDPERTHALVFGLRGHLLLELPLTRVNP